MIRVILQIEEGRDKDDMRILVEENETTTAHEREKGFMYGDRMMYALAALQMGGRK
jgi:hypothetical protein